MAEHLEGLLIIDKPAGWTSHDVVAKVRRLIGVRRVGHAGTLDPLATGVLPLGIGRATRLLEYLLNADKSYDATVRLGASTDTYDVDGSVVSTGDWSTLTEADVLEALQGFYGTIRQRPPAFSAIKVGGQPLHRLARAGKAVTAPERTVTVFAIDRIELALPDLRFSLRCSTGTYVRSIAHDLGGRLGCGAHLTALRRTSTAGYGLDQAVTLDRLEGATLAGDLRSFILPIDGAVAHLPAVELNDEDAARLGNGIVPLGLPADPALPRLRACDRSGQLIAILDWSAGEHRWRATKVLGGR